MHVLFALNCHGWLFLVFFFVSVLKMLWNVPLMIEEKPTYKLGESGWNQTYGLTEENFVFICFLSTVTVGYILLSMTEFHHSWLLLQVGGIGPPNCCCYPFKREYVLYHWKLTVISRQVIDIFFKWVGCFIFVVEM